MNALSNEEKRLFKQQLKEACLGLLLKRIDTAESAMRNAQESANHEDKSSAGDKYETARAMGQLDRDMNAKQLVEAQKEYAFLQAIDATAISDHITIGSVFTLDTKLFFIASGLGNTEAAGKSVVVLSSGSPLYGQLKNKRAGDTVVFMNKDVVIENLF